MSNGVKDYSNLNLERLFRLRLPTVKVFYDSEVFLLQKTGGVSRYFSKIIYAYLTNPEIGIEPNFTFSKTNNLHLLQMNESFLKKLSPISFPFCVPNNAKKALLTFGPIKVLNSSISANVKCGSSRGNIFHSTYYRPNFLESLGNKNLAITIHDFIPEKMGWRGIKNPHIGKKRLVKRADIVFCVSQTTANYLREIYDIEPSKIHIVPHGVSDISNPDIKLNSVQRPNILYVGGRWGYKNFKQLAEAMEILWEEGADIQLNTIGHKFSTEEIDEYFKPKFRSYWKNYENVSDDELLNFYLRATMLIITSKDEGFGLPILEAYSQGTHVLASDIPIFREVCGPLGKFFELGNAESLVEAIKQELNQALDFNLIGDRLSWASKFTWIDAAKKMALVYKNFA